MNVLLIFAALSVTDPMAPADDTIHLDMETIEEHVAPSVEDLHWLNYMTDSAFRDIFGSKPKFGPRAPRTIWEPQQ